MQKSKTKENTVFNIPEDQNTKRKTLEELTIKDDFMFSKVFSGDLKLAKRLVELVIGRKVKDIKYHKSQVTVDEFYNSKGIRLDVLLEGDSEWINVEMQNQDLQDLIKRNRYYTSLLTVQSLTPGKKYKDLPNGISIFITSFDSLKYGYEKYVCYEKAYGEDTNGKNIDITESIQYDGGYAKIYLNVGNVIPEHRASNPELRELLDYFRTSIPTNSFTEDINKRVELTKQDVDARFEYMTLEEKLEIEREEGIEKGRKEGLAEGEQNKAIEVAKNLLRMNNLSIESISQATSLSIEEIQRLVESLDK